MFKTFRRNQGKFVSLHSFCEICMIDSQLKCKSKFCKPINFHKVEIFLEFCKDMFIRNIYYSEPVIYL